MGISQIVGPMMSVYGTLKKFKSQLASVTIKQYVTK